MAKPLFEISNSAIPEPPAELKITNRADELLRGTLLAMRRDRLLCSAKKDAQGDGWPCDVSDRRTSLRDISIQGKGWKQITVTTQHGTARNASTVQCLKRGLG